MSRIAGSAADVRIREYRRQYVPIASTLAACLMDALPVVVTEPFIPDLAFLVLIAWRLLRPEMWSPAAALPLGLFADLVAGHPLGQSMAIWTITFLAFEVLDSRTVWRDYWMDWLAASVAIIFHTIAVWGIAAGMGSRIELTLLLPQLGLSIFAYPLIARLVLALDRWRLA